MHFHKSPTSVSSDEELFLVATQDFTPREVMRRAKFAGWFLALLLLSSCGGKSEEERLTVDVPAEGPVDRAILPGAIAQGVCALVEDCGCLDGSNADYNTCFNAVERTVERDYGVSGYAIEYDAELARGCLDAISASNCDRAQWIGECDLPFTGLRALGDECEVNIECRGYAEGGAVCGPMGICIDPAVPNGIACSATCKGTGCLDFPGGEGNYRCYVEDGVRCTEGGCAALAVEGEACIRGYDCDEGLTCACDSIDECTSRTCIPQLEEGESCRGAGEVPCQPGLYCEDGTCIRAEENGGNCNADHHCQSGNCDGPTEKCTDPSQAEDPAVCELIE